MSEDERDYFERRAEEELELAQKSEHADVVRAHYTLAGHYLDRVYNHARPASAPDPSEAAPGSIDEWAVRFASKARQDHGEGAAQHVAARIVASEAAGDTAGARMWEAVLRIVEEAPPTTPE